MKINPLLIAVGALAALPISARANCLPGPNVIVNAGHGASIRFQEPVYAVKIFDPSKIVLNEIPETGTQTLMLTQIDGLTFPGLPSTGQTTLLAETSDSCYTFQISLGTGNFHASIDADGGDPSDRSLLAADKDFEPLDVGHLQIALDDAVARVGPENLFLQRTGQFLELVEEGVGQRVAAQRLDLNWEYLTQLAARSQLRELYEGSVFQ